MLIREPSFFMRMMLDPMSMPTRVQKALAWVATVILSIGSLGAIPVGCGVYRRWHPIDQETETEHVISECFRNVFGKASEISTIEKRYLEKIEKNPALITQLTPSYRESKKFMQEAFKIDPLKAFERAPELFQDDADSMLTLLKKNPTKEMVLRASGRLRDDASFMLTLLKESPTKEILLCASERLRTNQPFMLKAFAETKSDEVLGVAAESGFNDNVEFMVNVMELDPSKAQHVLSRASKRLRKDFTFMVRFFSLKELAPQELTDETVLYAAFAGRGEDVLRFIQQNGIGRAATPLRRGPVKQAEASIVMKELVKTFMEHPQDVQFVFNSESQKYAAKTRQGRILSDDLELLLRQVQWEQIILPELLERSSGVDEKRIRQENTALQSYIDYDYRSINLLLRGEIDLLIGDTKEHHDFERTQKCLSRLFHQAYFALCALYRQKDCDSSNYRYLWRGDTFIFDQEMAVLESRIRAVKEGRRLEQHNGFMSTSHSWPSVSHVGNCLTIFIDAAGKEIRSVRGEREVIIPPTKIEWLYHKEVIDKAKNTSMHFFIARPVSGLGPMDETSSDPSS